MPHNSIFVLGPKSNRKWLHGIRADKRPASEKTTEELAYQGARISLTFRQIGTFHDIRQRLIWGSGAKSKIKEHAHSVSTDATEVEQMLRSFGNENHDTEFDWDDQYGAGFDVIDLVNRDADLVLSDDPIANLRVRLSLADKSIPYKISDTDKEIERPRSDQIFHPWAHGLSNLENPILKTAEGKFIEGDLAILFYLEKHYAKTDVEGSSNAQLLRCAAQSNELLYLWREYIVNRPATPTHRFKLEPPLKGADSLLDEVQGTIQSWEEYFAQNELRFVAGGSWTVLDCVFWPVLHGIMTQWTGFPVDRYQSLVRYHREGLDRKTTAEAYVL